MPIHCVKKWKKLYRSRRLGKTQERWPFGSLSITLRVSIIIMTWRQQRANQVIGSYCVMMKSAAQNKILKIFLFKRIACDYRSAVAWLYFWIFGKRARCPTHQNVKSPSNEKCTIHASVLASPWQPLRARRPPRMKNGNGFSTRGTNYDDYEKIDLHCVAQTRDAIFNYSASPASRRTAAGNGGIRTDPGLSWWSGMFVLTGMMSLNSVLEKIH